MTKELSKPSPGSQLRVLIHSMSGHLSAALPKHIGLERFMRISMTAITLNPKLGECTQASFMACLLTCAQLGLEPNTPLGHAYLIPRYSSKRQQMECTIIIGYQGLIVLSYQSGLVTGVSAGVVYPGDHFDWMRGLSERLEHKPSGEKHGPGAALYSWAVARIKGADPLFEVLPRSELDAARRLSGGGNIWNDHFDAMAKKTAIRRVLKYAPKSASVALAERIEDAVHTEASLADVVDPKVMKALTEHQLVDATPVDEQPDARAARGARGALSEAKAKGRKRRAKKSEPKPAEPAPTEPKPEIVDESTGEVIDMNMVKALMDVRKVNQQQATDLASEGWTVSDDGRAVPPGGEPPEVD